MEKMKVISASGFGMKNIDQEVQKFLHEHPNIEIQNFRQSAYQGGIFITIWYREK